MHVFRDWFLASRPWSFSMTAISVSVGSALAALDGSFSWPLYFLALIGAVMMHAASNFINDYDDVRHGVDSPEVPTARYRPHPLMNGRLAPVHVPRDRLCPLCSRGRDRHLPDGDPGLGRCSGSAWSAPRPASPTPPIRSSTNTGRSAKSRCS